MQAKNASITGYWGGRGAGKSTGLKEAIENDDRIITLDPIGDWGRERGFSTFKTLKGLYRHIKANWHTGFKAVLVVPRGEHPRNRLEQLADGLFVINRPYYEGRDAREITLIVEEMASSYPQATLRRDETNFQELVNQGRHYGINIMGASQRISEVHKNFVGNCAEHYFYRVGDHASVKAILQIIGPEYKEQLKSLQTHEYLHFSQGVITKGKNACNFKKGR